MFSPQIISKKRIVGFGSFHIGSTKFATIVLLLTRYMAPSARVVVYTVYKNELVANGIKLAVENMYENKVNILQLHTIIKYTYLLYLLACKFSLLAE